MAVTAQEIIQSLDMIAEYTELGIHFAQQNPQPNQSGWVSCWPFGKKGGKSPSASISALTGTYKDFSEGTGETLGFFDFACKYSKHGFKDWKDARKFYAKRAGLEKRLPRKEQEPDFRDVFNPEKMNTRILRGICQKYPEFSVDAILRCGGQLATYPKKSPQPAWVILFGCHGKDLVDAPPRGYAVMSATGHPIPMYQGEGNPPDLKMKWNKGQSGLVGYRTMVNWESIELIWKVEGISDLIAMENFIPDQYRDKHGVVTNSSGAGELQTPYEVAPLFDGKKLGVIHDCDKPGQTGSQIWLSAVIGIASESKNVVLPYKIEEKGGKDLRDWISDGHTYDELLDLYRNSHGIQAAQVVSNPGPSTLQLGASYNGASLEQQILKKVGCIVLGEKEDTGRILCFSEHLRKSVSIRNIGMYKYQDGLQNFGSIFRSEVSPPGSAADDPRIPFSEFRNALALEASSRQLTEDNQLSTGVWSIQDYLFLVNKGEIAIYNGSFQKSIDPVFGGKILDMGGAKKWYEFEEMRDLIQKAETDRDWRVDVYNQVADVFRLWDNYAGSHSPEILAAMVACTYVQSIWSWRPYVALSGPSNCGKTTMFQSVLEPLFGDLAVLVAKTSEAGLRQTIGYSSLVILLDEFEADKHRQSILDVLRTSGRGMDVIRGNANQTGNRFRFHHIPWFGAIAMGLRDAADRNRYLFIDFKQVGKGSKNLASMIPSSKDLKELGKKLCAVSIVCARQAFAFYKQIEGTPFPDTDRRIVDSYSLPASMITAIHGDDLHAAKATLEVLIESRKKEDQTDIETDEQDLIETIMGSMVHMGRGISASVSAILNSIMRGTTHTDFLDVNVRAVLGYHGVALVCRRDGLDCLFLIPKQISRQLLRGTHYQDTDLKTILKRIPNASAVKARIDGVQHRGVMVPLSQITQFSSDEYETPGTPVDSLEDKIDLLDGID